MKKMKTVNLNVFWVLLCMVLFSGSLKAQSVTRNIVLRTLDGAETTVGDVLGEDQVTIVSFWATWCKPCQNELEALLDLEDEWSGRVRVVAVPIDDSRAVAKVKSLVRGKRWPYEVVLDQNRDFYKALNLTAIPYVMVVNPEGKIVWSHSGYVPGNESIVVEQALEAASKKEK